MVAKTIIAILVMSSLFATGKHIMPQNIEIATGLIRLELGRKQGMKIRLVEKSDFNIIIAAKNNEKITIKF